MIRKKFMAVAMSAVLAVSLCPGLAMADSLTGGAADLSAKAPAKTSVSTKAKKTVYVLTDYEPTAYSYTRYNSDGTVVSKSGTIPASTATTAQTDTTTQTDTWTYNEKTGLLTSDGNWDFKYKGVNLKSATEHVDTTIVNPDPVEYKHTYTFKSKKGLVKKATYKGAYVGTDTVNVKRVDGKEIVNYTYDKKGNLTKAVTTEYDYELGDKLYNSLKKESTDTRTLTVNKKGLPTKSVTTTKNYDKSTSTSATTKYTYDKKKNLKKAATPYRDTTTYKYYGYKNGVPTKLTKTAKTTTRVGSGATEKVVTNTSSMTYTLTYKKLKVSKTNAAVAKRQQWALLNGTSLNGAFGNIGTARYGHYNYAYGLQTAYSLSAYYDGYYSSYYED